jgi:very-short-patch-repair endonuclease
MLEHLYLGYLTFDKFIIEIDPIDKQYSTEKRDKEIEQLGYRVIRIPELGLSEETVAYHVCPVIYP